MSNSAMGAFFGQETFEIAVMLVGVATIALLVSNSKGTVNIIKGTADSFAGVLSVATMQSNIGNVWNR